VLVPRAELLPHLPQDVRCLPELPERMGHPALEPVEPQLRPLIREVAVEGPDAIQDAEGILRPAGGGEELRVGVLRTELAARLAHRAYEVQGALDVADGLLRVFVAHGLRHLDQGPAFEICIAHRPVKGERFLKDRLRSLDLAHRRGVGGIGVVDLRLVQGITLALLVPPPRLGDGSAGAVQVRGSPTAFGEESERCGLHVLRRRLAADLLLVQEFHDIERELRDVHRLLRVAGSVPAGGIEERPEESPMVPVLVFHDGRQPLGRQQGVQGRPVAPPAQVLQGHPAGFAIRDGGGGLEGGEEAVALGQARRDLLSEPIAALGDDAADETEALGALADEMADDRPALGLRSPLIQESPRRVPPRDARAPPCPGGRRGAVRSSGAPRQVAGRRDLGEVGCPVEPVEEHLPAAVIDTAFKPFADPLDHPD